MNKKLLSKTRIPNKIINANTLDKQDNNKIIKSVLNRLSKSLFTKNKNNRINNLLEKINNSNV